MTEEGPEMRHEEKDGVRICIWTRRQKQYQRERSLSYEIVLSCGRWWMEPSLENSSIRCRRSFQHREFQQLWRNFDTSSCSSHIMFNWRRARADGCTGILRTCTRYACRSERIVTEQDDLLVIDVFCSSVPLRKSAHCIIRYLMSTARFLARCSISGQKPSPQRESSQTAFSIAFNQKPYSGRLFCLTSAKSAPDKQSESKQATVTKRMMGSEESTWRTTHAGHPSARQKSRSSVNMQWSQVKAPRASPRKARSGSAPCRLPRTRTAICVAWLWISNSGRRRE